MGVVYPDRVDGAASTCRGCGREVKPLANWCSACGTDLRSSVLVLDGETEMQTVQVETGRQPVRWRIVGGVLLALAVVLAVGRAGAAAVGRLSRRNGNAGLDATLMTDEATVTKE